MASSENEETSFHNDNEQTPFIQGQQDSTTRDHLPRPPSHRYGNGIFARAMPFMAIHFSLAFFEIIINAPQLYLFEQSLCSSYYRIHDPNLIGHNGWIEESYCKLAEIQHQLATVRGWKSFFDTLPGAKSLEFCVLSCLEISQSSLLLFPWEN